MKAAVPVLLIALVASTLLAGDAASDASAASPPNLIEVRFVDGSKMEVAEYEIHQNYVWVILPNGAKIAFDKKDIDLSSLSTESATRKTTAASGSTKPAPHSDLRSYAAVAELGGNPEIKISQTKEESTEAARENEAAYEAFLASLSKEQRELFENPSKVAEDSFRQRLMMSIADESLPPEVRSSIVDYLWPSVGYEHWITENLDGGGLLVLEDGSLWEINALDRLDTFFWFPMSDVVVLEANDCYLPFNYLIVNTDDDEAACARYVGR